MILDLVSCITWVTSGYNWSYDKSRLQSQSPENVISVSNGWLFIQARSERVKVGPWPQFTACHGLFMPLPAGPGGCYAPGMVISDECWMV